MKINQQLKDEFQQRKAELLTPEHFVKDSLKYSLQYSLAVEDFIRQIADSEKYHFALVSSGSFARRELCPSSDIDLLFIVSNLKQAEDEIRELVTRLWDHGLEASHTVRITKDVKIFLKEDLHAFTPFLETRFLTGSRKLYLDFVDEIHKQLSDKNKKKVFEELIDDAGARYSKYGNSPKVIEPNLKNGCGGLRDLQMLEWIYILFNQDFLIKDYEMTQAEIFMNILKDDGYTSAKEADRLLKSYELILSIRNLLHLIHDRKTDRLEFEDQIKVANYFGYRDEGYRDLMRHYFESTSIIFRFNKSFVKRHKKLVSKKIPDKLAIELDADFTLMGDILTCSKTGHLTMSAILRSFYYRGLHEAYFDEELRTQIIESLDSAVEDDALESSVFFREIMRLPKNIGVTLSVMNELGVLDAFMPEFSEMNGFIQHGVYHQYTADEHTIITIENAEKLEDDNTILGSTYKRLEDRELLLLALLFHDIAKPIDIDGHALLGAETADLVMQRLGYSDEEIDIVKFLVKNHLLMSVVAFRRNLSDADTLNTFLEKIPEVKLLDLLYVMTYADMSAVNPALWTNWKHDLLTELYTKARSMMLEKISARELINGKGKPAPETISRHSETISDDHVTDHINLIEDVSYTSHFTEEEIARHVEEIAADNQVSVIFKPTETFTNITVITFDSSSLLSKLTGVLLINDVNIHDARIFTRKDNIVIDTFNVTDFRTQKPVPEDRFRKIEKDFSLVTTNLLDLEAEIKRMKSRWWRIENKFFKRQGKVEVRFEEQDSFSIIDIQSPDRLGFLYQVTHELHVLGLNIFYARILTQGDEVIDSFYVLDKNGQKLNRDRYSFVRGELKKAIEQIM